MTSNDYVICPYCHAKHFKSLALGETGLINTHGNELGITCIYCKEDFTCTCDVKIKFITKKIN